MLYTASGIWTVEIIELQPNAPHYFEGASLGELRQQLDGKDEGFVPRPDGNTHWISLKCWQGADSNHTRLQIQFRFAPDALPPKDLPPGPPVSPSVAPKTYDEMALSEVNGSHRFEIRLSTPEKSPLTTGQLLALPELAQTVLPCPLCDRAIVLHVPLLQLIQNFALQFDSDDTHIDVCLLHPCSIPEIKRPPANYPLRVTRYWLG